MIKSINPLRLHVAQLHVLIMCALWFFGCSELKTVDTSLHELRNGNMGFGLEYTVFKWRFGNQNRILARREEVECLWQASIRNARPDSISIAIGFRLFDVEGDVLGEIKYNSQKISYPDTIADVITLGPGDTSRTVRGTFWVERENALRTAEADIFIINSHLHYTPGPDSTAYDSISSEGDSSNFIEGDTQGIF